MRLEISRLSWVIGVMVTLSVSTPAFCSCGLNWSLPANYFDGVNERGAVSIWEEIDAIDMGDGLKIPLIINFRSDRNASSNYLGSGWMLSLLESHLYQTNERNFVMVQPDGPNRYFYRVNPQDSILKDHGGWAAEIKEDTVTAWAECGWKLTFKSGRLVSMQTPENRQLDFVQVGGREVELREGGKVHLKAVTDPSTGQITGLEFNNRRIGIELENRPLVQKVNGQTLVAGMAPSLSRLTGIPKGPKEYSFTVDDKLQPQLTIAGKPDRVLSWNPVTKLITSDTGWTYHIQPGKDIFANAAIQRKNAEGGTESWHYDRAAGTETEQALNGVKKVTTYFTSSLLVGKLRRVEEISGGKTRVLRELSYNEKGQLVRETGPDGGVTAFQFDDHGRLAEILRDGKPFARRVYDEKNRVTEEEVFGADKIAYHYLADGGYEKTTLAPNGETAKLIYDKTEKLVDGVFSDGSALVHGAEFTPTIVPATSAKREELVKKLSDDLQQLSDPILREELLIRIGRVFSDHNLGPPDPQSAIKVYESILQDPSMDAYSKAQAHTWITSACLDIGDSEWPKGREHMEKLLELKKDGLPPERQEALQDEQNEGFGMLLALMDTGEPKKDEEMWRATLKKFGASPDYQKQLDDLLAEQKRQLSSRYFNNN